MKKILASLLLMGMFVGFSVHAQTAPVTYQDVVNQLISLLEAEIASLQAQIQTMLAQQATVSPTNDNSVISQPVSITVTTPTSQATGTVQVPSGNTVPVIVNPVVIPPSTPVVVNPGPPPICQDSNVLVNGYNSGYLTIPANRGIKNSFTFFATGGNQGGSVLKSLVVTRQGGSDDMFSDIQVWYGSYELGDESLVNGKAVFNNLFTPFGAISFPSDRGDYVNSIQIFGVFNSDNAIVGTELRLGIADLSDIRFSSMCIGNQLLVPSLRYPNNSSANDLMGQHVTIGQSI